MDGRINQQTLKRTNKNNILVKNILQSKYLIKIFIFSHSYGGPGTQTVSSKWGVGWDTYLASQRNFIVANIDVRGTGFQVSRACNIQHSQSTLWNHSQTVHVSS